MVQQRRTTLLQQTRQQQRGADLGRARQVRAQQLQDREEINKIAKQQDTIFRNATQNFQNISQAEEYFNSLPSEIRNRMELNPTSIQKQQKQTISNIDNRIKSLKERLKRENERYRQERDPQRQDRIRAREDRLRGEIQGLEEGLRELNKGNIISQGDITSYASSLGRQEFDRTLQEAQRRDITQDLVSQIQQGAGDVTQINYDNRGNIQNVVVDGQRVDVSSVPAAQRNKIQLTAVRNANERAKAQALNEIAGQNLTVGQLKNKGFNTQEIAQIGRIELFNNIAKKADTRKLTTNELKSLNLTQAQINLINERGNITAQNLREVLKGTPQERAQQALLIQDVRERNKFFEQLSKQQQDKQISTFESPVKLQIEKQNTKIGEFKADIKRDVILDYVTTQTITPKVEQFINTFNTLEQIPLSERFKKGQIINFQLRGIEQVKRFRKGERIVFDAVYGAQVYSGSGSNIQIRQATQRELKDLEEQKGISLNPLNAGIAFINLGNNIGLFGRDLIDSDSKTKFLQQSIINGIQSFSLAETIKSAILNPAGAVGEMAFGGAVIRATQGTIRGAKAINNNINTYITQLRDIVKTPNISTRVKTVLNNEIRVINQFKRQIQNYIKVTESRPTNINLAIKVQNEFRKIDTNLRNIVKRFETIKRNKETVTPEILSSAQAQAVLERFRKSKTKNIPTQIQELRRFKKQQNNQIILRELQLGLDNLKLTNKNTNLIAQKIPNTDKVKILKLDSQKTINIDNKIKTLDNLSQKDIIKLLEETRTQTPSDFKKLIKAVEKETGLKVKIFEKILKNKDGTPQKVLKLDKSGKLREVNNVKTTIKLLEPKDKKRLGKKEKVIKVKDTSKPEKIFRVIQNEIVEVKSPSKMTRQEILKTDIESLTKTINFNKNKIRELKSIRKDAPKALNKKINSEIKQLNSVNKDIRKTIQDIETSIRAVENINKKAGGSNLFKDKKARAQFSPSNSINTVQKQVGKYFTKSKNQVRDIKTPANIKSIKSQLNKNLQQNIKSKQNIKKQVQSFAKKQKEVNMRIKRLEEIYRQKEKKIQKAKITKDNKSLNKSRNEQKKLSLEYKKLLEDNNKKGKLIRQEINKLKKSTQKSKKRILEAKQRINKDLKTNQLLKELKDIIKSLKSFQELMFKIRFASKTEFAQSINNLESLAQSITQDSKQVQTSAQVLEKLEAQVNTFIKDLNKLEDNVPQTPPVKNIRRIITPKVIKTIKEDIIPPRVPTLPSRTPPRTPVKPIPKPKLKSGDKNRTIKKSRLGEVSFVVRDRNTNRRRVINIKTGLPFKEAKNLAAKFVDNTILASFNVKEYGAKQARLTLEQVNLDKFRRKRGTDPKVRELVEKRKYRLDKPGEIKQISQARIRKTIEEQAKKIRNFLKKEELKRKGKKK